MFKNHYVVVLFISSVIFHFFWIQRIGLGTVPGPVDPFLKTLQGYSLYASHFSDQSLFYAFRDIDTNYEFCLFQKDIFTFRVGNSLLGPFPIALSFLVGLLFHIFDYSNIFYFFASLNLILYFLIFKSVKPFFSIAFLCFFGLPFFIPNSEVSEHSFLILTQMMGYYLLKQGKYKYRNVDSYSKTLYLLSGLVFGLGAFLRHEVLLFGNFIIATYFLILLFQKKRKTKDWISFFYFAAGIYLAFLIFFLMNKIMYGSSVGPRLNTNSTGLYADYFSKLSFYKVILWREGPNFGLFGNNTLFILTLIFVFYYRRKWNSLDKFFLFPSLGLILFVPLLAPNNGGSPWGARYLFLCIFPLVYLSSRVLFWLKKNYDGRLSLFIQLLFLLTVIQTLSHEIKSLNATKAVSIQQSQYIKETSIENTDLVIYTSELVAMQIGINYIKYPNVLLKHESQFSSFENKFLIQKNRFRNIVLIEPKTDHLNLNNFSPSDLEGMRPDEIIRRLDERLVKIDVVKGDLTIAHRYVNK